MIELNLNLNTNSNLQANGYDPNGKYYARVETKEQYDLQKLAKHMHQHNAAFSTGLIVGILTDMVTCMKELILEGNTVKIDNLGIFKASVEANGLTLTTGAKISAGKGSQRTDAELTADITRQQFAVSSVKLIMQASGDTTKDDMTSDARLSFTSKAKDIIKRLTGATATDDDNDNDDEPSGGGNDGGQQGGGGNDPESGGGGSDGGDDDYGI